ncbi:DUF4145 domain-containing protein [Vibrio cholerae]|uniref:DUF4145 domain-containing protein n=1 Tax=Vibrio TaxID=662 RepID=UPI0011D6A379|nr:MULTISPECIES: DUF4145 domain-containing protein [Vibrio]EGR0366540.1 DUF4145 domain-containing protein [Vibrio cholerae]EIA0770102.1 DUF4145 domain-containing protein [Vibrio cholerae]MCS0357741.1 DUF4145 domain-containing protein [Vibrio diabolicus]TXY89413.1 DUF4145 domain-containing protein [Vibrio cholerae]GIA68451.1 hypothetical protein VCSRO88_0821 [Vibrio cholerae]
MKFVVPEFKKDGFHCPLCGVFAHMTWEELSSYSHSTMYHEARCSCCKQPSLWRVTDYVNGQFGRQDRAGELIYPDFGTAALPEDDMPEDVKKDYVEAARIFSKSPRGAAALLRLGLQKLCKHLGEDGKNINTDIRQLAAKNVLPPLVVKVADTVRITGNNAVHPGEMADEDFDYVASKMFELLNFIVKKGISEPKELESLYQLTPEGPRKSAEASDAKSKVSDA